MRSDFDFCDDSIFSLKSFSKRDELNPTWAISRADDSCLCRIPLYVREDSYGLIYYFSFKNIKIVIDRESCFAGNMRVVAINKDVGSKSDFLIGKISQAFLVYGSFGSGNSKSIVQPTFEEGLQLCL